MFDNKKIKSIGIAFNPHRYEITTIWPLISYLSREYPDIQIRISHWESHWESYSCSENEVANSDVLIVLGGDGSVIHWAQIVANKQTPILGINYGTLGFVTEVNSNQWQKAIDNVVIGNFIISKRLVLKATYTNENTDKTESVFALNEVVIKPREMALLILDVNVGHNGQVPYRGDGLIITTPTGSTAYSLSAGGSIIHPSLQAIEITPLCPQGLNSRPVVIPATETIEVKENNNKQTGMVKIIADCILSANIKPKTSITIEKAEWAVGLIQFNDSFYYKLTERLQWGRGII